MRFGNTDSLIILVGIMGALAACKQAPTVRASTPKPRPQAAAPAALQNLLTPDLLGEEVPYFERLAGPAMKVDDTWRLYKVAGCTLEVQPSGTKIIGVRLTIAPNCDADVSALTGDEFKFPPLHQLTFGTFADVVGEKGVIPAADCLHSCGNREATGIYAIYEGPHADDELQIMAEAEQYDEPNRKPSSDWANALLKAHGEAWVEEEKYNCGLDPLGLPPALRPLKLNTVTIGRGMKLPDDSCQVHSTAGQSDSLRPTAQSLQGVVASDPTDQAWYFLAFKLNRCVAVSVVPGQYTPEDVLRNFSRQGNPQIVVLNEPTKMLMKSAKDPTDAGTALAKGKSNCEITMAIVKGRTQDAD